MEKIILVLICAESWASWGLEKAVGGKGTFYVQNGFGSGRVDKNTLVLISAGVGR